METAGVVALFQRSLEKSNLVFRRYTGDVAVTPAQPYVPNVFTAKERSLHTT